MDDGEVGVSLDKLGFVHTLPNGRPSYTYY